MGEPTCHKPSTPALLAVSTARSRSSAPRTSSGTSWSPRARPVPSYRACGNGPRLLAVPQDTYPREAWNDLLEKFNLLLTDQLGGSDGQASDVPARPGQARH